jgi:hypothetical protein
MVSCQKEGIRQNCDGENAQNIETFYAEEFENIICRLQNIGNDQKEVKLVITNQADFEKYISCSGQLPVIDFDKYFILSGAYIHHQCAVLIGQQVSICNNRIVYDVKLLEQDCQAVTTVYYVAVIEKKYSTLPVEFVFSFKY